MSYFVVTDGADRQQWLEARKKFITASEVACILDVGFMSPTELASKKKQAVVSAEEDAVGKLAMVAAGRHLEAGVLAWFADETPHLEFRPNRALLSRPGAVVAATPDAIMDEEPVDSKLAGWSAFHNWTKLGSRDEYSQYAWASDIRFTHVVKRFPPITLKVAKQDLGTPRGEWRAAVVRTYLERQKLGALQVPLKYIVQLHVQMYVMDAEAAWITVCIGGDTRLDFRVARSRTLEQYWLEETARFIDSIGGLS